MPEPVRLPAADLDTAIDEWVSGAEYDQFILYNYSDDPEVTTRISIHSVREIGDLPKEAQLVKRNEVPELYRNLMRNMPGELYTLVCYQDVARGISVYDEIEGKLSMQKFEILGLSERVGPNPDGRWFMNTHASFERENGTDNETYEIKLNIIDPTGNPIVTDREYSSVTLDKGQCQTYIRKRIEFRSREEGIFRLDFTHNSELFFQFEFGSIQNEQEQTPQESL